MGIVRTASQSDAQAIADIYAPYVRDTAISFEEIPPDAAEMARRIASILPTYPYLVFDEGGGPIGYAYASVHNARASYRWSVDVAVYIDARAHRKGVGRALYSELLELLTRQGFHSAFAGIVIPNDRSVGLHEAMGFTHLGTFAEVGFKLGAWRDVGWWRRPLSQGLPATEPIPMLELGLAAGRGAG